jgi:hypothetical protein
MSGRELARRIAIWSFVGFWFACMTVFAIAGDLSGLFAFPAFPVVGAIILTSRPANGVGRVLLTVSAATLLVSLGTTGVVNLGLPAWMEAIGSALTWPFWILTFLIILVFPTGRIETRLGRVLAWIAVIAGVTMGAVALFDTAPLLGTGRTNPLGLEAVGRFLESPIWSIVPSLVQAGLLVAVLVELGIRWHRADAVERLQFRWLVFAACVVVPLVATIAVVIALSPGLVVGSWVFVVMSVVLNLIPIAILIAVTRHGLYQIDRIISRTVSYTLVTLAVVAVYAVVVTSASLLLPEQSTAAVAVATLAAAALFLPLLRILQRRIDRRFDREHYDATRIVEDFGERLRTGVDPAATTPDLVGAVERALQPSRLGIWTTGGDR